MEVISYSLLSLCYTSNYTMSCIISLKKAKSEVVKLFIHQNVPEPYTSIYCQQFDEA